ncbi:MAG: hypothetical protein M5U31_00440 [Acidimicrobiia bacterium]|nr:hypothetical protein [Acidimicrobiia bacterium]
MSAQPSREPSGWAVGWAMFAAIMLMVVGFFHIIAGIGGIADDTVYVAVNKWVFEADASTWGWIHLLWGIVLVFCGVGIFTGNIFARTVGVIAAGLSALAAFAFLPYYPVWAVIIIAIDVAVIWALTAHGRDITLLDS